MSANHDIVLLITSNHAFDLENLIYLKILTTDHNVVLVIDDICSDSDDYHWQCQDEIEEFRDISEDLDGQIDLLEKYDIRFDKVVRYSDYTSHVMLYGRRLTVMGYIDDWTSIARGLYPRVICDILRINDVYNCTSRNVITREARTLGLNEISQITKAEINDDLLKLPIHLLSTPCIQTIITWTEIANSDSISESVTKMYDAVRKNVLDLDKLIASPGEACPSVLVDPVKVEVLDGFDHGGAQVIGDIWIDEVINRVFEHNQKLKIRLRYGTTVLLDVPNKTACPIAKSRKRPYNWIANSECVIIQHDRNIVIRKEIIGDLSLVKYENCIYYTTHSDENKYVLNRAIK